MKYKLKEPISVSGIKFDGIELGGRFYLTRGEHSEQYAELKGNRFELLNSVYVNGGFVFGILAERGILTNVALINGTLSFQVNASSPALLPWPETREEREKRLLAMMPKYPDGDLILPGDKGFSVRNETILDTAEVRAIKYQADVFAIYIVISPNNYIQDWIKAKDFHRTRAEAEAAIGGKP